ncbi:MFS transporter [Rosistilla oblonga]|uniref:MFS transporter n=1 Tax=Rosistilla oblonga TaxID=2527990 RepID=UPI003A97FB2A
MPPPRCDLPRRCISVLTAQESVISELIESSPASNDDADVPDRESPVEDRVPAAASKNFIVLMLYQVVLRVGWIFKTESVIMPAVLDFLGGSGMLRGLLPPINRVCQSLPALLMAGQMQMAPRKKIWLCVCTVLMAICFALLAVGFYLLDSHPVTLQVFFIAIYAIFFVATGMTQVLFHTLQGKLIPVGDRGRLLLVTNVVGVTAAVGAVWICMPAWVTAEGVEFHWLFATSSIAFFVAAAIAWCVDEPAVISEAPEAVQGIRARYAEAVLPFRDDPNFRRLAVAAALFGSTIMLFPHYQSLGRGGLLGGDFRSLMLWLIVQNLGTAAFSMVVGPLADRRGNRIALRLGLIGVTAAPLLAIGLVWTEIAWAFPIVFVLVGLTPVLLRLFMNYTLEVAPTDKHPSYLAAISVATGLPVLCSPVVGMMIDRVGFSPVFVAISLCGVAAWWISGRLEEPRCSQSNRKR